ncbi:MAG: hypothetical protein QGI51_06875 [Dehalococcoidales bacterium]|jgi:DNA-3-methyladenine glycosylase II|nr:hypothetical protein [Dehalococcoidales bacterium]MDP6633207.1 hypothetical protein [Dehalococcoidales bacterium]
MPYNQSDSIVSKEIVDELATRDHQLAVVIGRVGSCRLERGVQGYPALVHSVIGQQLSSSYARAIRTRLAAQLNNDDIRPDAILKARIDGLREAGMSRIKAQCVCSLAEHVLSGEIDFSKLEAMEDEDIVKLLTRVKGIGRWTAEMFLMFSLGRLDILPLGDQSIRSSIMSIYGLTSEGFRSQAKLIGEKWRPYRTVASWYLYRYFDLDVFDK